MLDTQKIRADFPILQQEVYPGVPLVFLDSAASSQRPVSVLEAMDTYYLKHHANVHRGIYRLSEEASNDYEDARERIARFINAPGSEQVIYVRNATEGFNLVAYSWARHNLHEGDEILLTEMEHHANLVPWQMIAKENGIKLRFVPILEHGTLDLSTLPELLTEKTKLFSFTAVSNVLGTVNPVRSLVDAAHSVGALAMVDAAQAAPHLPVDVQAWDCDFTAFSGHKMCGPTGIGILYGKRELLEAMPPFMGGGDMILRVRLEESTYNELPWKFEAGTPAIAEAVGLGAAVDYLSAIGMEEIHAHEQYITGYALEALSEVPGLRILGPSAAQKGGVAAFTLAGIHPHDIAELLDKRGVAVRAGHHCAMPLHHKYGINASTRASFYLYTTTYEVDQLVQGLHSVREVFRL
ncbi:MAG: cysteine desulfurase [Candidatus Promineifilaceae bacterium]|jgi:cysteine desulfurase/selenocysteine lyase